jgi:hypothetical protein
MNGVTPFLNKLLPKKYGFVAKKKSAAAIRPAVAAQSAVQADVKAPQGNAK